MKKLLLVCIALSGIPAFSQIAFSSLSTSNITQNSASLNAYVTINCANGGNFHAQFSTTPTFAPNTNATGGSVFVSFARTINISGLTANTTYYWRYYGSLGSGCNQTLVYSPTQTFTTLPTSVAPTIQNISVDVFNTSANINYLLNANSLSSTSVVKYGLTNTALSSQATGGTATGSNNTATSAYLTGLTPNTTYFYQVEATNSIGTTQSPVGSFTTTGNNPNSQIANYTFDNTYYNNLGYNPFASNAGTTFTSDRSGNANSALNINNTGTTALIANLPYASSARTISLWFKLNALNGGGFNFLYNYGNASNYYGSYVNGGNTYQFGETGGHGVAAATVAGTWYHVVFVYDGTNSKIYRNGVLLATTAKSWNTISNGDLFRLGLTENGLPSYFDGTIDDLKIFNYAISDADVTSLYNNNSILGTENFQAGEPNVVIYPNPANEQFTVALDRPLKSVTIYSLQGQKMLVSHSAQINVTHLVKGVYLVQVEDENEITTAHKLVVR